MTATAKRIMLVLAATGIAAFAMSRWHRPSPSMFGPDGSTAAPDVVRPLAAAAATMPSIRSAEPPPVVSLRQRIDLRTPGAQSAEPSIVVRRSGLFGAGTDEVVVVWMDSQPGAPAPPVRIGIANSIDGGSHWQAGVLTPPAASVGSQFDPMTAHDAVSGNTYVGAMSREFSAIPDTIWMARQSAVAPAFAPSTIVHGEELVDKGWMAAGPPPASQTQRALYLPYSIGIDGYGLQSFDGGLTFDPVVPLPPGIGFQPRVADDGRLSISYATSTPVSRLEFVTSSDGLQGIGTPVVVTPYPAFVMLGLAVPGSFRVSPFALHAIDPRNGRIYLVYSDITAVAGSESDMNVVLRDSVDGGQTWSAPRIVNGDSTPFGDQFMPWIECDAEGRLHVAYFDTRRDPASDAATSAMVDVYYATSTDGGVSWQEIRLTDTPLLSSNATWTGGLQFFGDYLGVAASANAAYVAYPGDDAGEIAMWVSRIDLVAPVFANGFE